MAIDFRPKYRELQPHEQQHLERLKFAAETLDKMFDVNYVMSPAQARLQALARTHLESAVMFAVKALTA